MARKFPPGTLCVYCAEARATTVDHVPPKGLFAKGHRHDLIRAPACCACNGSFSTEDEYARQIFTMAAGADDSLHVREARARALKSMERRDHRKMLEATHRNFSLRPLWKKGVYHGRHPVQRFDRPRICRFVARIVVALFYHELRRVLPLNYTASVEMLQDDPDVYPEAKRLSLENLHGQALSQGIHSVADGAFEYAFFTDEAVGIGGADPNYSCWALKFYGTLSFVAFTPNQEIIDEPRKQYCFCRGAAEPLPAS